MRSYKEQLKIARKEIDMLLSVGEYKSAVESRSNLINTIHARLLANRTEVESIDVVTVADIECLFADIKENGI